jgi:hypothetical protein
VSLSARGAGRGERAGTRTAGLLIAVPGCGTDLCNEYAQERSGQDVYPPTAGPAARASGPARRCRACAGRLAGGADAPRTARGGWLRYAPAPLTGTVRRYLREGEQAGQVAAEI